MPTFRHFAGRRAELDLFRRVMANPAGQAILIVGPQGMGKSTLAERMLEVAREDFRCPGVRYEVIASDSPDAVMERILHNAHAVAGTEGSFSGSPHRLAQWKALFEVLPKGRELTRLVGALRRDEKRPVREQLVEVFHALSKALPAPREVLFLLDSEKHMHLESEEPWRIVVRDLPPRVKLLFAQRPEDVLASSLEFGRLDNVVRIPEPPLAELDAQAVEELIGLAQPDTGYSSEELLAHFEAAAGHPYVVAGSLDLLLDPEGKPDALALLRLPEHVLAAEGEAAFVEVAVGDHSDLLRRIGLWADEQEFLLQALGIAGKLELRRETAIIQHKLGVLIQDTGSYEEALDWYRKSLAIVEELGDRAGIAQSLGQLGVLAAVQERPAEGVPYNLRGLAIHLQIGSPEVRIDLHWLTRQREMLGEDRFLEILAEHLEEESRAGVLGLLARHGEAQESGTPPDSEPGEEPTS